jgi:hypothetical protein
LGAIIDILGQLYFTDPPHLRFLKISEQLKMPLQPEVPHPVTREMLDPITWITEPIPADTELLDGTRITLS